MLTNSPDDRAAVAERLAELRKVLTDPISVDGDETLTSEEESMVSALDAAIADMQRLPEVEAERDRLKSPDAWKAIKLTRTENGQSETYPIGTLIEMLAGERDELRLQLPEVEAERDDLRRRLDWLWGNCNITLYLPHPEYPIEHNPHANKDGREAIEARRVQADTAPEEG